jgi:tRNA nucleotidyltransferase/poly(A) polymerase
MTDIKKLHQAFQEFQRNGIDCFYVGGCVRDREFGIESQDIDICLVGVVNYKLVTEILSKYADKIAAAVGEFPVWIVTIDGSDYDFALARKETKEGDTRQDFLTETFGVTIEQDLLRRDITINAIAVNCLTGAIVDPYNGVRHIKDRIAFPVSIAFAEDPLRVYRVARFIARFNLFASEELIEMCKEIKHIISKERIGLELHKVLKQADKPSQFFHFLKKVDWLKYHFSFLDNVDLFDFVLHTNEINQGKSMLQKVVILCRFLELKQTKEFLESITFLDGNFQMNVCHLKVLIGNYKDYTTREKIAVVKRRLDKHGIPACDFFELIELFLGSVTTHMKDQWESIVIEPIISGKILIANGIKEGPEIGLLIKKALSLQDQGLLDKNNWEQILNKQILN